MRLAYTLFYILILLVFTISCKKETKKTVCFPDTQTIRFIENKKAVVKITASAVEPVYLVEEGTIDTRLIPCNFPHEFYQDELTVTVNGEVKSTQQDQLAVCCAETFVISEISR